MIRFRDLYLGLNSHGNETRLTKLIAALPVVVEADAVEKAIKKVIECMGGYSYCCSSAQNTHEKWFLRPRRQPHFPPRHPVIANYRIHYW